MSSTVRTVQSRGNVVPPQEYDGGTQQVQRGEKTVKWEDRCKEPGVVQREITLFVSMIDAEQVSLRKLLKSAGVDYDEFIVIANVAVSEEPKLLDPDLRMSLFRALQKCARFGLLPDKKQASLIPTWNNDLRCLEVRFQIGYQGLMLLARRHGDVPEGGFVAEIVYKNEPFSMTAGDNPEYRHEQLPHEMVKGLDNAIGCYCIITTKDGRKTRRFQTADRIRDVKAFVRAKSGPWFGKFEDEMWRKTLIIFTCKYINTTGLSKLFQEAIHELQDEAQIDFDAMDRENAQEARQRATIDPDGSVVPRKGSRLDQVEAKLANRPKAPPAIEQEVRGPDPLAKLNQLPPEPEHIPHDDEVQPPKQETRRQEKPKPETDKQETRKPTRAEAPQAAQTPSPEASAPSPAPQPARIPPRRTGFREFVIGFDDQPVADPILTAMGVVTWLEFELTQCPDERAKRHLFEINRDAIEAAYHASEEAARKIEEISGTKTEGSRQTTAEKSAAADKADEQKWVDAFIREKFATSKTEADLRRHSTNQAFIIRTDRYKRAYPDLEAQLRKAYEDRRAEIRGAAR